MGDTIKTMPMLHRNRDLFLDEKTVEKITYLTNFKNAGNLNDIVNKALKEYLAVKFKELNLLHYIDLEFEQRVKNNLKRQELEAKKRDNIRLVEIAKRRILEREVEKLKAEEKRMGKKISLEKQYPPVKVEMLRLTGYEGKTLNPGDKIIVSKDVAERWEQVELAKIIKK